MRSGLGLGVVRCSTSSRMSSSARCDLQGYRGRGRGRGRVRGRGRGRGRVVLEVVLGAGVRVKVRGSAPVAIGHGHGQVDDLVPDRVGALLLRGGGRG